MKYQLRRMVLVNAGTNVHVPSGRITAIDPRGGAAVVGDNGVGKTTTLRALPLFFGHLPSQIVSMGQGQEPMVRFVLPTDASAIAFEYQRGSDDDADVRLAVIRRRADDPDVPFYRLYRCGFRKELFIDEGRFLSDDETQAKATALEIQTTSKLSTSEYRSVILRTPATSRDKDRLRRYSVEWSFGPKQLDNLDRLVAAMVKKHINFADIVQVAVGMVQLDLGHGSERAKLSFKQGRAPIERWLRNREACADAFRLAPTIAQLEDDLQQHRLAEAQVRSRRADVVALVSARNAEREELCKSIETLRAQRERDVASETITRVGLSTTAADAKTAAAAARTTYEGQAQLAEYFESQRAAHWETELQDLSSLRVSQKGILDQVAAAEALHSDAVAKYARVEQEAQREAGARALDLERDKQPHRERCAQLLERIAVAEEEAKQEANARYADLRRSMDEKLEPLFQQRGAWEGRQASPTASEDAINGVTQASEKLQAHTEQRARAQQESSDAKNAWESAMRVFHDHEQAIRVARADCEAADATIDTARKLLSPSPGSFLAILREHGSDTWKRNLAKVINPSLLEREDLDPAATDEEFESIYGWHLSTGVIASPDWVDDELARNALETAQARGAAAHQHLTVLQDGLTAQGRGVEQAAQAFKLLQAKVDVLNGQTESLKTDLGKARHRVEKETREAAALALSEVSRLKGEIDALKTQAGNLRRELADRIAKIRTEHDVQRGAARKLQDDAILAIDANVVKLKRDLDERLRSIRTQRDSHLSSEGVDVDALTDLKVRAQKISEAVRDLEEKESLVARWREWQTAGGSARVASLKAKAEKAAAEAALATDTLTQFDAAAGRAATEHETVTKAKKDRLADVDDDLTILAGLEDEFGDYLASGQSVIDLKMPAREMRGKVQIDRNALSRATDAVNKRASNIRQTLTAKDSAVKELIEASLGALSEASEIRRAVELCACYKLIGPQIANDVNLTLKTLLANIGAFQKAIQSFEREVAAFNRRLQAGLNEVRRFERIRDLRLDIITNFENLGFYKKLARMDDIVRQHANEFGKDYTRDLPPDETARALGDFISVLSSDGSVEVNLSSHITLNGSLTDNGQRKEFKRASELENVSSEGLTSLVLITLMTALLNTIRGAEPVHVPWVTDEVGKFDPKNFVALMRMLQDNRIDVVTASPELGPAQQAMFAQRYLFEDRGRIREYSPLPPTVRHEPRQSDAEEVMP